MARDLRAGDGHERREVRGEADEVGVDALAVDDDLHGSAQGVGEESRGARELGAAFDRLARDRGCPPASAQCEDQHERDGRCRDCSRDQ